MTAHAACPACGGTVLNVFRHCILCGWFVGWGP